MQIGAFELNEPLPELRDPHVFAMVRPWVDVGSVGTLTLNRLERFMGSKELGRLSRPGTFFDFTRYRPNMRLVDGKREVKIPNSIIRYAITIRVGKKINALSNKILHLIFDAWCSDSMQQRCELSVSHNKVVIVKPFRW